jgi:SAM-dependent methyltransferase
MKFDGVAQICEDTPEFEKNAVLAATVLAIAGGGDGVEGAAGGASGRRAGRIVEGLGYPRIEVGEAERGRAAQILGELGLTPGEYWVACVTGTANVSLKAWRGANWAQVLREWAQGRGARFLFVGLEGEAAGMHAVHAAMGPAAANGRVWTGNVRTFTELLGLTALSRGYVGHDTGPMHLAAAMGKPTLAVFGGGHRLRFQPAVAPSVTVTVGVSCRGCQWVCSFAESHCVKAVPIGEVLRAAEDLEVGRVKERESRILEPDQELQVRMVREAAEVARERLRAQGELSRTLRGTQAQWERDVADLRSQVEVLSEDRAAHQRAAAHAHAELGSQLREKESMIRRQDEQLREKETALHEQHALLQAQLQSLQSTSDESERLRGAVAMAEQDRAGLAAELEARAAELARLQAEFDAKSREAAELAATIGRLEETSRASAEASRKQSDELAKLRVEVQRLEERVRAMEPHIRPRRTPRQILVDLVIGRQHYYPPPPKHLPGITVVTVTYNAEALIRDTVESVLGQNHPHTQLVIVDRGSTDDTLRILEEYKDRIGQVVLVEPGTSFHEALATGYSVATYDVLGRLDPGDVYEPGGLMRVAEFFRDHPGAKAVIHEETVSVDGWRLPAPRRPVPDVYQLLRDPAEPLNGVFVTTNAYQALNGLNPERGHAAQWDFWLRLARRYGIRRATGHVRSVRPGATSDPADPDTRAARDADFARARELFESGFGVPGRVRCSLIHWANRFDDAVLAPASTRLSYPSRVEGKSLPPATPPTHVPGQPICPLNGRLPDRLLFSARDTLSGDGAISHLYYDTAADAALAYPPIDLDRLSAMYRGGGGGGGDRPRQVVRPDDAHASPYAGYRPGGRPRLGHLLSRVRSPWWWFRRPDFGDLGLAELLDTLDGRVPQRGVAVRFLNVGCFDGATLDALKSRTDWSLFGTETNPDAARAARAKGYTVWETSAEDAAFNIPIGETFNVIYLGGLLEHLPDPLLVVRRLRQILSPGGRIVLATPNLDSKLLDLFGPTWSLWQAPYHRTLLGRRGLRTLAGLAAFRVERLRTRTHPLPVVKSVQLNGLGLAGAVPDTAEFPPDVASRGVLLAGWARLLWDWRGRGDYMYAVLRAE